MLDDLINQPPFCLIDPHGDLALQDRFLGATRKNQ